MANDFNLSGTKCISCPYEARLTELSITHERTVTELKTYIEQLEGHVDVWIENQIKLGGFNNAKRINNKASKSNMGCTSHVDCLANNNNSKS